MGNVASLEKMWEFRKQNKATDFRLIVEGKTIMVHKKVLAEQCGFFARLFEDNPTLEEYSMDAKFEVVEWIISSFYEPSSDTFVAKFDHMDFKEKLMEYLTDVYLLSVRYSIHEFHSDIIKATMCGLTMKNVFMRLDMAFDHEDRVAIKLLKQFIKQNGGMRTRVEEKLTKLGL
ncbi:hypothetical protein M3Y94_00001500 [Aphelenchoides besseyi]|nr:hypothetical protein M3Y94_00001500 [Aphelenchoides besseyi]KAI6220797.1 hypothetical protein M3Y95_01034300 [Aphelenchoides besseyi]